MNEQNCNCTDWQNGCDCDLEYQDDEAALRIAELQYVCIQRGKEIERLHSALEYWRSAFIAMTLIVSVAIAVALSMIY